MATIYNKIEKVAGEDLSDVLVTIELVWDTDVSPVAKIESEDVMIQDSFGTGTDSSGEWSQEVTPNDLITPADSLYKITERRDGASGGFTYYISVEDSATPTFWVGDLIVTELPDWV